MKEVRSLEQLAEHLLEGGFARVLKPRLQPVQIAKALAREMDRSKVVGADAPLVANRYTVHLHPDDLAGLSQFQASLEHELAGYLRELAAERGYRPLSHPVVTLEAAASGVAPGRMEIEASLADPASLPSTAGPLQGTISMPVISPQPTRQPPIAEEPARPESTAACLVGKDGESVVLPPSGIGIGRAVDNDLVLDATGVSRHHARIEREGDRYVLHDLGSTNGTFVAGRRVTRQPLSDGDLVSIGRVEFRFRVGGEG